MFSLVSIGKAIMLFLSKQQLSQKQSSPQDPQDVKKENLEKTHYGKKQNDQDQGSRRRVLKEYRLMIKEPIQGIYISPDFNDTTNLKAAIDGPLGSSYEGGRFHLTLNLSQYVYGPPHVQFTTPIYHPNIDSQGEICLNILMDNWTPALHISKILLSIQSLLTDPNPEEPFVPEIGQLFLTDRAAFEEKVKEMTQKYAMNND